MLFKKNWFTNFIWITAAVVIVLNVLGISGTALKHIPFVKGLWKGMESSYSMVLLGTFLGLIVVLGLVFVICHMISKAIYNRIGESFYEHKKLRLALEITFFVFMIVGATALRVVLFQKNPNPVLENDFYFEMSMIRVNESLPILSHNASYFYIILLSFVMSFLGNKVMAAVALNLVLQVLTVAFGYWGVRNFFGFIPAVVSACAYGFCTTCTDIMFLADAQCLTMFCFAIGLFCLGRLYQVFVKESGSVNLVLCIVFAGLMSGFGTFVEPYGIILMVLGIGILVRDNEWFDLRVRAFLFGGFTISAMAFLLIFFTFQSMKMNVDLINPIRQWFQYLVGNDKIHYAFYEPGNPVATTIQGLALICGAFWGIPGYCMRKKTRFLPAQLMMIVAPVPFCLMGYLNYTTFSIWIWSILAGCGIQSMVEVRPEKVEDIPSEETEEVQPEEPVVKPKKIKEIAEEEPIQTQPKPIKKKPRKVEEPETVEKPVKAEKQKPVEALKAIEEPMEEPKVIEEPEVVEKPVEEPKVVEKLVEEPEVVQKPVEEPKVVEKLVEESEVVQKPIEQPKPVKEHRTIEKPVKRPKKVEDPDEDGDAKPVNLIPNPLPVPKKHVKKKVDFAVEVKEDEMDFDFDISDDDDFDF